MEIGDYVRTKYGRIGKITSFNEALVFEPITFQVELDEIANEETMIVVDTNYNFDDEKDTYFKKDIIKSSPNIIDLIEVGDYVNGEQINSIKLDWNKEKYLEFEYKKIYDIHNVVYEKDIKSIVTKEEFKEKEYIVNGNCR